MKENLICKIGRYVKGVSLGVFIAISPLEAIAQEPDVQTTQTKTIEQKRQEYHAELFKNGFATIPQLESSNYGASTQAGSSSYPPGYSALLDIDTSWINLNQNVIRVAKDGSKDFTSIQNAMSSILDSAKTKQYTIEVYPGVYDEQVTCRNYVHVVGTDRNSVIIRKDVSGQGGLFDSATFRTLNNTPSSISNITVDNPGRQYPSLAIYMGGGLSDRSYIHNVDMFGGQDTIVVVNTKTEGSNVTGTSDVFNVYTFASVVDTTINGTGTEEAFFMGNGGQFLIKDCTINDAYGVLRLATNGSTTYLADNNATMGGQFIPVDLNGRFGDFYTCRNNFDPFMPSWSIPFDCSPPAPPEPTSARSWTQYK